MKNGWQLAMVVGLVLAAGVAMGKPASSTSPPKVKSVTLEVHHRVYPDFVEWTQVGLKEEFQIGDTPFSAKVVEFIPDFAMDLKTRKIISRSNEPKNPAFRIIVRKKGVPQDTSWALLGMPPHFAPKSLLAFQVTRVDFLDRPPVVSPDSTAAIADSASARRAGER